MISARRAWTNYAICLDTPEQAQRFNRRLVNACLRAHTQAEPVRPGQLHVAIIGAGATGTELSAELHRTVRGVVAFGLDKIDPDKDIRITLIEAAERIVPALPRGCRTRRARCSASSASKCGPARASPRCGATASSSPAANSYRRSWWCGAAGVRGPDVLRNLDGLEANRADQLVVRPTLQTTRDDDIFAIGDCACLVPARRDAPGAAARAGGAPAGLSSAAADPAPPRRQADRAVRYRDFGSLVSLGEFSTIGSLMGFLAGKGMLIEGYFARLMYRSLYKMHETALHGPLKVALDTHGAGDDASHRAAREAALNPGTTALARSQSLKIRSAFLPAICFAWRPGSALTRARQPAMSPILCG